MAKKIVGHKTFSDGQGGFRHEPLYETEAKEMGKAADAAHMKRIVDMPDEKAALRAMMDAWLRLVELGWREAMYCPKDGSTFRAIEAGSSGVHDCYYQGEWPTGSYWTPADGELWPSHPILFKVEK